MKEAYLEVTFRHGQPIAAYYSLPHDAGARSVRTQRAESGLLIDFTADDRPMGIEITAPGMVSVAILNRILDGLGLPPATEADLAPLIAA
jgi:hypothetical protein